MGGLTEGDVLDLDDVEGWIRLVNICDATPFKTVVVNTPAQSNVAVAKHVRHPVGLAARNCRGLCLRCG